MKYVKLGIWCMMLAPICVWAQSLDLQTSTNKTDINSTFGATVVVEWIQWGDVSIAWIENFEVVNQSRSQSIQVINGRQSSQVQLQLNLKPKEVGTYTLGPAVVDTPQGAVSSQSVLIEVDGESLFGSSNTLLDPQQDESSPLTMRSFNRIGWFFGLLVLGLIVRVFQVARRKQLLTSLDEEPVVSQWVSASWGYAFTWPIQQVLVYARRHHTSMWSPSLSQLIDATQDGELAWLLMRMQLQTYSDSPDPLLEDDCVEFLAQRWHTQP